MTQLKDRRINYDSIDSLFDDVFFGGKNSPYGKSVPTTSVHVARNVYSYTKDGLRYSGIDLAVPGLDEDGIKVTLDGTYLKIAYAPVESKETRDDFKHTIKQIANSPFVVEFSVNPDYELLYASQRNGILTIMFREREKPVRKPTEVTIQRY